MRIQQGHIPDEQVFHVRYRIQQSPVSQHERILRQYVLAIPSLLHLLDDATTEVLLLEVGIREAKEDLGELEDESKG